MSDPDADVRSSMAGQPRALGYAFSLSWSAGRIDTIGLLAAPMLQSFVPAALALTVRGLVNAIVDEIDTGVASDPGIRTYVAVSLLLSVILASCQAATTFFSERNVEALNHALAVRVLAHAETLDFGSFENPAFHDTIERARENPGLHAHETVLKFVRAVAAAVTLVTLSAVLLKIEPWLLAYLLPLSIPFLVHRWWLASRRYATRVGQTRSQRWIRYYSGQMMAPDNLGEVRLLGLGRSFIDRIGSRLSQIRTENRREYTLQMTSTMLFNVLATIAVHLALYQAARRAIDGELSVGDIAVFAGAAAAARSAIDALIANVGFMRWNLSHLLELQAYFALESASAGTGLGSVDRRTSDSGIAAASAALPADAETNVLVLQDVTFSYPSAIEPTLDGFSMSIAAGETVALVGPNGSGKSTIVKLITGLYVPQSGTVRFHGLDPAFEIHNSEKMRKQISVVFQNSGRYQTSVAENIEFGDWPDRAGDRDHVERVARRAGLHEFIAGLPDGYDTVLGRELGTTTLSGGQWQKLAIARAFAKDASLMVLDEPTSNLDPDTEFAVFEQFRDLARGKATLLISHRFSTLALADRIVVIHGGRAAEQGTAAELIERGGIFAEMHARYRSSGAVGGVAGPP